VVYDVQNSVDIGKTVEQEAGHNKLNGVSCIGSTKNSLPMIHSFMRNAKCYAEIQLLKIVVLIMFAIKNLV
jgi:hypothetical protein